jgi:acetolactate synthase-1/2/3 large subunit
MVGSVSTLAGMVTRGVELARRPLEGPVYLNVPLEVLLEPAAQRELRPVAPAGLRVSPSEEIAAVVDLLLHAERPVVVTESAARSPGAYDALVELCETLELPVVEPQSAICANFPRAHRLHRGSEIPDADLIVLVNCRAPFYPPSNRPEDATIVVIDDAPQRPHVVYQVLGADRYLEGDVGRTLETLAAAVRDRRGERPQRFTEPSIPANDADAAQLVRALGAAAPANTLFVDETITHSRLLRTYLSGAEGSYIYVQGGLGQGLPVALGAKYAARERPVVLAIGDGAFLYNPVLPSLCAARDLGLPLVVVIFNNGQYLSMKMNHLRFYPDGAAVETGDFRGVDLRTQPELSELAAPFGFHAENVHEPAELAPALERAFAAGTTAIVNVHLSK